VRAGLAITMLVALAECDSPGNVADPQPQPQAKPIARTVLESEDSAKFRMAARRLYASLGMPSCDAPAGFDRKAQLEPERTAVAAFEARLGTSGAAFQLAIARADAEYALGCWSDGDIAFARKHVEMTREDVAGSLASLRALLPSLDRGPVHEPIPARSTAFRGLARRLVETVQPQCQLADGAANEAILAPALELVRQFQARLPDAVHRHHYAIAKADVDLEQSMTLVECAGPSRASPDRVRDELLADVHRQIAALQAIRL